jgi:hypothetical protein
LSLSSSKELDGLNRDLVLNHFFFSVALEDMLFQIFSVSVIVAAHDALKPLVLPDVFEIASLPIRMDELFVLV